MEKGTKRIIVELINKNRFKEAERRIKLLLKERDDPELWYLLSLIGAKNNELENALEYIENALMIEDRYKYYIMKGILLFQMGEYPLAERAFREGLKRKKSVRGNIYLALSLIFQDKKEARDYIRAAWGIDKRKTKEMLKELYSIFVEKDIGLPIEEKRKIKKDIEGL